MTTTAIPSYHELFGRNLGFVNEAEQERLRAGAVFIAGVGGMGGACAMALARAGVGRLAIADFDHFEPSNVNRQVFAFADSFGREKAEVTRERLLEVNPDLDIETYDARWTHQLDAILSTHRVVVNGMDDAGAAIQLYRKAREHGATVIDAYTAPLPSVTVVRPGDPRPEERLRFPTLRTNWSDVSAGQRAQCLEREVEWVLTHSSAANHVDLALAGDVIAGRRSRMSFAPMVVTTGCLMSFEAIALLLGRKTATDHRGWFLNPWTAQVERPRSAPIALVRRYFVRRFIRKLLDAE